MKYCFIINPAAGKKNEKNELKNRIETVCAEKEIEYDILFTQAPADAQRLIKEYYDCHCDEREGIYFFACGGDGTACEVLNGIMALDDREKVYMGIIPVGTGNDFVRNFSDKELFFDVEAQVEPTAMEIDVIKCNDMYALNMVNIGFDCEVVVKTNVYKKKRFVPSRFAYIMGLIACLAKKPGACMSIKRDDDREEKKQLLLATFANGSFCGGGFHSNPFASLRDGRLDVMFIKNIGRIKFLSLVGSYKKGTHMCEKNNSIIEHAKEKAIHLLFDRDTNVSVDGEVIPFRELYLESVGKTLKFLLPKGVMCAYADEDSSVKELLTV